MLGYAGRWAQVDLTNHTVDYIELPEKVLRDYLGGTGIGAKLLFDQVQPGAEWDSPENYIIIAGGPLNGTHLAGAGAFSVVTKGPLTNGATSTQANGFFGAYLKTSGFDGLIIHGSSSAWVYLYLHDGIVEIREGGLLKGLDTQDSEEKVKELIKRPGLKSSVFSIGPAGENLVRFASLVGDRGHVASKNGIGAVLGSKKLKAIAGERGTYKTAIHDSERMSELARSMVEQTRNDPKSGKTFNRGTSHLLGMYFNTGLLPYKNLTSNVIGEEYLKLGGEYYRERFELKRDTCWACPSNHCNVIKVTEGPYAGFVGDEPEYELFAGMGTLIGQSDPGAVVMLSNLCDRLGFDGNETSWLMAFMIECFERGLLNLKDTDGLELRWGNVETVRSLLAKIAVREGIGNLLAEGVMRAAENLGGEAENLAVYLKKGHAPRGHDHRSRWFEMFDAATSGTGTIESIGLNISDPFSPTALAEGIVKGKPRNFVDSLVVCMFPTRTMTSAGVDHLVEMLKATTGWDYTTEEAFTMSLRVVNLLRAFNIRHGITPDFEYPSPRYGSVPVDGPAIGKDVMKIWDETLDHYYKLMGWDRLTGRPRPDTLQELGLDDIIKDLY
ncbi:aldehyde ferredoxin oxidoreductase family protein [Paradesulfitobacterium aromaticivorans]